MTGTLVRRWEATIARADIDTWLATFRARAFPSIQAVPGFRGITVHAERDSDPCRLTVLTAWEDMEAIKRFAGGDPAKTVMPDFMAPFFPTYDSEATFHDELMLEAHQ